MIKAVIFDYNGVLSRDLIKQEAVYQLAAKLRSANLQTAILSNMIRPIAWVLNLRGDFKDFETVVISSEVGYSKPDPEIYKIILNNLKLEPQECLFIDDRPQNLKTAEEMGINIILAISSEQIISDVIKLTNIVN